MAASTLDSTADAIRTAYLHREGFHLLRFWNNEVLAHPDAVYEVIVQQLLEAAPLPTFPRLRVKEQLTEG